MKLPRLMIAGSGSGCGKTTLTCGLLRLLQKQGIKSAAFKCGPDYIDPLYHRKVLGTESRNLDSFFCDGAQLKEQLLRGSRGADIAVIEGVMGYYDGLGLTQQASCAEIALKTKTPVILVLDAAGRSASVLAELQGFLRYSSQGGEIRGVLFNRLSAGLYEALAKEVCSMGVRPCGFLPRQTVFHPHSRHLGLVLPEEIAEFQKGADRLAEKLSETVDLEALLALAAKAEDIEDENEKAGSSPAGSLRAGSSPAGSKTEVSRPGSVSKTPRIAAAKDEAFCFSYAANLECLEALGARIVPFSPIRDRELPDCDGLYLPGGYPELHARELSGNVSMRESVRRAVLGGVPTIAECGGFLYLHETLTDEDNRSWPMAGALPGSCRYAGFQRQFGYVCMSALKDSVLGEKGTVCRGHAFHYFSSDAAATDVRCDKPLSGRHWEDGVLTKSLYAGFTHLWLPGSGAAKAFLRACERHMEVRPEAEFRAPRKET